MEQYIGVDLHKQFFQACALDPVGGRLWELRFPRTDGGLMLFRARCTPQTALAVEACGAGWPFGEAGRAAGARLCFVDPRKTRLKAGFAAKTDRLDARRLADALRRDSVVSIYLPPLATRGLRGVCRGRHQVVRLRTRLAQMIRALLLRCDAGEPPGTRLYAPRALAWLAAVQLPSEAQQTLRRLERLYREVPIEAQAADAEVRARAATDPIAVALETLVGIGPIMALTIRAEIGGRARGGWETLVGIGPIMALTIRAEIGDRARCASGPALACYAGLVPRVDRRADRVYHGRITRDGSPWRRWALVEVARHAIRQPDTRARWARRLALRKGLNKGRGALARGVGGPGAWRCGRDSIRRGWPWRACCAIRS